MASRRRSASRTGTRMPVSPSTIDSLDPMTSVVMTGSRMAPASRLTTGNPSRQLGRTKMSTAARQRSTSQRIPRFVMAPLLAISSATSGSRPFPSSVGPTNNRCSRGSSRLAPQNACTNSLMPFSRPRRATVPIATASPGTPNSRRSELRWGPSPLGSKRRRSIPFELPSPTTSVSLRRHSPSCTANSMTPRPSGAMCVLRAQIARSTILKKRRLQPV